MATLFALVNAKDEVAPFLAATAGTIGLVVVGRIVTTQFILTARRRRVVAHPTVIIGGGIRAAEMATLLKRYPQYGLAPVGFVDDSTTCAAEEVTSRLGCVDALDLVVAASGADVILVADGDLSEVEPSTSSVAPTALTAISSSSRACRSSTPRWEPSTTSAPCPSCASGRLASKALPGP